MRLELKRKPATTLTIFLGIWILLFLVSLMVIATDYFFYGVNFDREFLGYTVIFSSFAVIVFRQFLWLLKGKEIIEIKNGNLTISREGTFWTFSQNFELSNADQFLYEEKDPTPSFLKLYGFSGGHIQFSYLDFPKRFGQTVEKKEAEAIIEQINYQRQILLRTDSN